MAAASRAEYWSQSGKSCGRLPVLYVTVPKVYEKMALWLDLFKHFPAEFDLVWIMLDKKLSLWRVIFGNKLQVQ